MAKRQTQGKPDSQLLGFTGVMAMLGVPREDGTAASGWFWKAELGLAWRLLGGRGAMGQNGHSAAARHYDRFLP